MPGKLIVCPTPIGNLDDITPRVREALVGADYVACEDTRRTGPLLDRLGIRPAPRLISNHEGNETARATELAQRIERGARVALVTDAGMPAISDPGFRLIRTCIDRDLEVEVLPGPSVVPVALVASGLPTDRWRFEGFLPRRAGEMERVLRSTETVIAFESPRRLCESLARARRDRARPPRRRLPRAVEAARGGRARHAGGARPPLPRRRQGRDRARDRPRRRPRSTARTSASRSTPCATWSSRARGRAPRRASSRRSPAPAPTISTVR